ncbi:hypothetical protein WJR50_26210 [Catalinimonas sp. 4WD22]|uniref:hypothetical protein n=1 Tax=Catalinimonas locisalis TaxID=3133978 RepID=UPI0031011802
MKTVFNTFAMTCIFTFAIGMLAQTFAQSYKSETELIQDVWGMEKQEIIKEYMELNELEAQAFWPIYEEYAEKRKKIGAEKIDIIMEYAANYTNMADKKAADITNGIFKNNMKLEKLQKKYYGKLAKVIAPVRATEFMQLEKYLDNAMSYELQNNIPFLKEVDKLKDS